MDSPNTPEERAQSYAVGNTAAVDKIANPDNLKFSEAMRTLFIGDDSGTHINNFLWPSTSTRANCRRNPNPSIRGREAGPSGFPSSLKELEDCTRQDCESRLL